MTAATTNTGLQVDRLHDVAALLLAIVDAEDNHTTRLARMAHELVRAVVNELSKVKP